MLSDFPQCISEELNNLKNARSIFGLEGKALFNDLRQFSLCNTFVFVTRIDVRFHTILYSIYGHFIGLYVIKGPQSSQHRIHVVSQRKDIDLLVQVVVEVFFGRSPL